MQIRCAFLLFFLLGSLSTALFPALAREKAAELTVLVTPHPARTFLPMQAIGGAIDGQEKGDIARSLTPGHIRAMLSAGLGAITYRLRTELGCEAWHWNPQGRWSDSRRQQGYWISNSRPGLPIRISNGYGLPRRGNTIDQANNHGYSRLDDGSPDSFWKSNPYLDHHFTGDDNARHPQWVIMDLEEKKPLDALRIRWGTPFATRCRVQFWQGKDEEGDNKEGDWKDFPGGRVENGAGGDQLLHLCPAPVPARYVRIILETSANQAPAGSEDIRDELGYAIRELYLGVLDKAGHLRDIIRHGAGKDLQTKMYVSSTDPWHRAIDQDQNVEQPGFGLVFRSGLSHRLPVMAPTCLLYGAPEDAAAELRYLKAQGFPVRQVELGEEADGQYITPEDYGALFIQWARALHRVDPSLQVGGPSLQSADVDFRDWPERPWKLSWLGRFLAYLRSRGYLDAFSFCSFEWYPFDEVCVPTAPQLAAGPSLLAAAVKRAWQNGLPRTTPLVITELGYSAFAAQAEVEMPGALLDVEATTQFLEMGGSAVYVYGYEPNVLIQEEECPRPVQERAWGQNMLFQMDDEGHIRYRMPTYYGIRLLTREWASRTPKNHRLYPVISSLHDGKREALVTAFALHRPDGLWSILLLNKDAEHAHAVRVQFRRTVSHSLSRLSGAVDLYQFSPARYRWHSRGEHGYPSPDLPPRHSHLRTLPRVIQLPPYSISVVRGRVRNVAVR